MRRPRRDKEHMAIRKKNNFEDRYAKGIHFDIRNKGTCFITMQTNAGPLTVYIDSMDGLDDAPLVNAWIPYRRERVMIMGGRNYKLKPNHPMFIK
jgi:hypothetical protein